MADRNNIVVVGFKVGEDSFEPKAGGMTIADIEAKYADILGGSKVTWVINGEPVSASARATTRVNGGDRVEAARANRGGC